MPSGRGAKSVSPDLVLDFWFPPGLGSDPDDILKQVQWWFRGGSNDAVRARFPDLLTQAETGQLGAWLDAPRTRLALIIVLDQFSRAIFVGDGRAYRNDARACEMARAGLENGHYAALSSPWEKVFFSLPFGHSERLADAEMAVELAGQIALEAPGALKSILAFSADQAKGHRDVIARFGRHPHRNALLGRVSTAEEQEYLNTGQLVHERPLPRGDGLT